MKQAKHLQLLGVPLQATPSAANFGLGLLASFGAVGTIVEGLSKISSFPNFATVGVTATAGYQTGVLDVGAGLNATLFTNPIFGGTFRSYSGGLYSALSIPGVLGSPTVSVEAASGFGFNVTKNNVNENTRLFQIPTPDDVGISVGSAFSGAISVSGILITQVTSYRNSPAVVVSGAAILGGSLSGSRILDDPFAGQDGKRGNFEFRVTWSSF